MLDNVKIVWVEIGRKLPRHLINNVKLHKELYPKINQVLVTDTIDLETLDNKIEVVNIRNLGDVDERIEQLSNSLNRTTLQREFWLNTTSRFLALESLLKESESDIIHLESDCILLSASDVLKVFTSFDFEMAYPAQADGIGCASILLLKKGRTLEKFTEFIFDNWSQENQDDMNLLGSFSTQEKVLMLPSSPSEKLIFDPQIYGRYLVGTDARNIRFPFSRRGLLDLRLGAPNPSTFEFSFATYGEEFHLSVHSGATRSRLMNIHLHSKRIPVDRRRLIRLLEREVRLSRRPGPFWRIGRLDRKILLERIYSSILRRIFKREGNVRLR